MSKRVRNRSARRSGRSQLWTNLLLELAAFAVVLALLWWAGLGPITTSAASADRVTSGANSDAHLERDFRAYLAELLPILPKRGQEPFWE